MPIALNETHVPNGNQHGTDGSAHVIDHNEANPRYMVTPEISGTPTPNLLIDGVGTANLIPYYLRVTVNPGDDYNGANRLMNGYPDTITVLPDNSVEISSDEAITNLYLIAIGNVTPVTAAPANYTNNAYIVTNNETDIADFLAGQAHMTFDSADNVRKVRITMGPVIGTNYANVTVEGLSYA